jgi:hypothetical protein
MLALYCVARGLDTEPMTAKFHCGWDVFLSFENGSKELSYAVRIINCLLCLLHFLTQSNKQWLQKVIPFNLYIASKAVGVTGYNHRQID